MEPIRIKIHSFLNVYLPEEMRHRIVELQPGPGEKVTVAELLSRFSLPREEVAMVTVNKKRASRGNAVLPGDLIEFFPVIGGG
jgi:sulfur carrier protein ThiS